MKHNVFLLYGLFSLFPGVKHHEGLPSEAGQSHRLEAKLMPDDTTGVHFFDDFSGRWPGQWLGDVASFRVTDGRLGLTEKASAPVSVAIPSPYLKNTVWEAGIQVDGAFTASRYVRLYLAATNRSPHEPQDGYHLQIDGVGDSHVYRLWRQNGPTRSVIFESHAVSNQENRFRARIRVTCSHDGRWQILADEYDNGSFVLIASKDGQSTVVDATYTTGGFSGYLVNCSPAHWPDFKLDYLLIKPLDTTAAPNPTGLLQHGDILINEILSNPKPNGVDFVEIYNHTDNPIDLAQIDIARVNAGGVPGARQQIAEQPLFLYPHTYTVLTSKPATVSQHYPRSDIRTFVEMPTLPNFNNETGGVVLYHDSVVIDSLFYTPAMQSPFIVDHQGVSLERQHFSESTHAPGNFQSAAVSIGGATPGYQNSRRPIEAVQDEIFLTSKTFSPDNDGFEDQLEINYRLRETGFMANIDIYTDRGRLVRRLQRNQSMATHGTIAWDGLSDNNQRLPIGMYIAVIEIYNANGARKMYRKSFVLAAKL